MRRLALAIIVVPAGQLCHGRSRHGAPRFPTRDECIARDRLRASPRRGLRATRRSVLCRRRSGTASWRSGSWESVGAGRLWEMEGRARGGAQLEIAREVQREAQSVVSLRRSSLAPRVEPIPSLAMNSTALALPVASREGSLGAAGARRPLPAHDPYRHVPQAAVGARGLADALRHPHVRLPRALRVGSLHPRRRPLHPYRDGRPRLLRRLRARLPRGLLQPRHGPGARAVGQGDGEVRPPLRLPRGRSRAARA